MSKNPDSTDFPHWENPRICCTCVFYRASSGGLGVCHHRFTSDCIVRENKPACPLYSPKKTD